MYPQPFFEFVNECEKKEKMLVYIPAPKNASHAYRLLPYLLQKIGECVTLYFPSISCFFNRMAVICMSSGWLPDHACPSHKPRKAHYRESTHP